MKAFRTDELWVHLYWLTVLAEAGSFTRAADRLEVSKAAMSQKIKELENMAGTALVQRTTRSVRLTSAGEKLVDNLGRSEQVPDMRSSYSSGAHPRGTS